ncbi:MAG: acetylglutamate kinase [bacterium]|nr:acetylglutamate kinase [bacterium]
MNPHQSKIEKAKVLLEALPYIQKFSGSTIVIKYGGSLMIDDAAKEQFAQDIVLLKYVGINPVIVHGGGKEISKWMQRMGKEAVFIDGLRVTDEETMEITEMVLSGKINNEVVTLINTAGGQAVGLSGKSANLFNAIKIKSKNNEDLGQVGRINKINPKLVKNLSKEGYIPVISSVGADKTGASLNLNADNVAAQIAKEIGAKKLIYLTDVEGIFTDGKLNSELNLKQAKALISHKDIKEGMVPKLEFTIDALENDVDHVHIINGTNEHAVLLELFTNVGIGTMISRKET